MSMNNPDPKLEEHGHVSEPLVQSLSQVLIARKDEYIIPRKIRIKIGSWNVANLPEAEKDIAAWLVEGRGINKALAGLDLKDKFSALSSSGENGAVEEPQSGSQAAQSKGLSSDEDIDLYVVGLQEIVDVGSATEAFRPFNDPGPSLRWKSAVESGLPHGFLLAAEQQLHGLYLMIYASAELYPSISSVSYSSVGTGLMGYLGNKGAVTARLVLGETTRLVFVNCHLAAGAEKANLDRRNWDAGQIVSRTKYEPIHDCVGIPNGAEDTIGDEDFTWWLGDLNYRLDGIPGDDVRRLLLLHTRNEYDIGSKKEENIEEELARIGVTNNPEDGGRSMTKSGEDRLDPNLDPASLQATLSSLLSHDQLQQQQRQGKCFHDGWREGAITFLPTYKYDVGSFGMFDTSEKKRAPSWCDRILYRSRRDREEHERKRKEAELARRKDEEMKARGVDQASEDEDVLFDYDPETDGADDADDNEDSRPNEAAAENETIPQGLADDSIVLEKYFSHQAIVSSDHKPLVALFSLKYEAADPLLKAAVHQEVARELDRVENETRAGVTVVIEDGEKDKENGEQIDFGSIVYNLSKKRGFTVANTSQVAASLSFVRNLGPPDSTQIPWLSISFDNPYLQETRVVKESENISLDPGDAINVVLTALVQEIKDVRLLNERKSTLDEILVLRLMNGRDHFIPVHGEWAQSVFGRSIEELIRVPEGGVRHLSATSQISTTSAVKWSAPLEVFQLTGAVEDLTARAVAEWDMTKINPAPWDSSNSWPFDSQSTIRNLLQEMLVHDTGVREALDTGRPISSCFSDDVSTIHRLEAVCRILLEFLGSLSGGVIDLELWTKLDQIIVTYDKQKPPRGPTELELASLQDILSLSPSRNISFVFITGMLGKIVGEIAALESSKDTPTLEQRREALAELFGPLIIQASKPGEKDKERRINEARAKRFIVVFMNVSG